MNELEQSLDTICIGNIKMHVNLPRFVRGGGREDVSKGVGRKECVLGASGEQHKVGG